MKISTFFAEAIIKANEVGLSNNQVSNADSAVGGIMNTVYMVAGMVAVIGIIIGGYLYVISRGDQSRIVKAKNAIMYSLIGLVVVMMAFAITQVLIKAAQ